MIPERLRRRAAGLRHWADGVPAQMAAVELLVSFGAGRPVDGPWVRPGGFVRSGSTPTSPWKRADI